MIGLDCNILVQLALADHPANTVTVTAVNAQVRAGRSLMVPSSIVTEFLHVVTDQRRFTPPLTMNEALDWTGDFLAQPKVKVIEPSQKALAQALVWMRQHKLGRKRILDTHLAAILHTSGISGLLTSNPSDFALFGVIQTVAP
jgi:predicted nucleic acid-binding protein